MNRTFAHADRTVGRAFSLFELVLVIVIMALMAGIAIPMFAGANARYRLDAAALRLQADADHVAERARASGAAHEIEFDKTGGAYTIYSGAGEGRVALSTVRLAGEPYRAAIDSVSITGGGAIMTFDGFGRPYAGVSVVLGVGEGKRTLVLADDASAKGGDAEPEDDGGIKLIDLPVEIIGGLLGGT